MQSSSGRERKLLAFRQEFSPDLNTFVCPCDRASGSSARAATAAWPCRCLGCGPSRRLPTVRERTRPARELTAVAELAAEHLADEDRVGRTISPSQANYDGNYTYGSDREGRYIAKTVKVGSYPPNRFGLHDMHGNVWEWVEDCWNDGYHGAPTDGSAWTRGSCGRRVLRGGSWNNKPRNLRSADRNRNTTGNRNNNNGFRVARTLRRRSR